MPAATSAFRIPSPFAALGSGIVRMERLGCCFVVLLKAEQALAHLIRG